MDYLLVRIHLIIVMIRWTALAPWEFEFPGFAGVALLAGFFFFFTLVTVPRRSLILKLSHTRVYAPQIQGYR